MPRIRSKCGEGVLSLFGAAVWNKLEADVFHSHLNIQEQTQNPPFLWGVMTVCVWVCVCVYKWQKFTNEENDVDFMD